MQYSIEILKVHCTLGLFRSRDSTGTQTISQIFLSLRVSIFILLGTSTSDPRNSYEYVILNGNQWDSMEKLIIIAFQNLSIFTSSISSKVIYNIVSTLRVNYLQLFT